MNANGGMPPCQATRAGVACDAKVESKDVYDFAAHANLRPYSGITTDG